MTATTIYTGPQGVGGAGPTVQETLDVEPDTKPAVPPALLWDTIAQTQGAPVTSARAQAIEGDLVPGDLMIQDICHGASKTAAKYSTGDEWSTTFVLRTTDSNGNTVDQQFVSLKN